jgi:cytochrome c553
MIKTVSGSLAALMLLGGPALAQSTDSGRLLASNCFQCHGTNGRPSVSGFDRLAGSSSSEIYSELKEMQGKTVGNDIMKVHARGYTDTQLRAIAAYFAAQR